MTTLPTDRPLRLLFVCTGNSERSQIAQSILNHKERAGALPFATQTY